MRYNSLLSLICAFFTLGYATNVIAEGTPIDGNFSSSSVYFDMNACSAYNSQATNVDYSEFTGVVDNSDACLQMQVMNGGVYRQDPLADPHSCTEGVNGSNAMCVSSVMDCNYPAGHKRSVRIDILVRPGTDGTGTLSGLSFFEQAPPMYTWVNGGSGLNNYPTRYGVRVLRDGSEIWRSENNMTTADWTLESFSFINDPNFVVETETMFSFELIGYCLVGNGAAVNAWDLDEIRIESSCGSPLSGGVLTLDDGSTSTGLCVGTGNSANVNVNVTGAAGTDFAYIITDANGVILDLPASGPPFDFQNAGLGTCLIWHASYSGALTGLAVGNNANNVQGCLNLSNAVTVNRYTTDGGTISSPSGTELCSTGSSLVEVTVSGAVGTGRWVVTDTNGNILGFPAGSPIDVSQYALDNCIIWYLSSEGSLSGVTVGANANNITGDCFDLSNPLNISKVGVTGGVISSNNLTYINICDVAGSPTVVDVTLNNNTGNNSQYIIADSNGNIIDANPSFPMDFEGMANMIYEIYNVSWNDTLNGLVTGGNINNLNGFCFGLSNSLTIDKEGATGGTISSPFGTEFEVCISSSASDPIDFTLTGASGTNSRWVITDPAGKIIGLPQAPPFGLDPTIGDDCVIWHLSFEDSFRGLFLGQNASDFEGCFDLSNPITVSKISANAGSISQNGFSFINLCGGSGTVVNITNTNNISGSTNQYLVTDMAGNIIDIRTDPNIDFGVYADGTYEVVLISASGSVNGIMIGQNISSISGDCFDFSNTMTINKYSPVAGTISTPGGSISVCSDGIGDNINVSLSGNSSTFSRWLVTDTSSNIIGLPGNPPFNFEGLPDGTCLLWHLSYENGISGIVIGRNANDLRGCFALSNSIEVNKSTATPGSISSNGNTTVSICLEDNIEDIIEIQLTSGGSPVGTYIITDDNGNILEANVSPPFDLSGAGTGICRIYHVTHDGNIGNLSSGNNLNSLTGCYGLSNSVTVNRGIAEGGTIRTDGGFTEVSVCVSDGNSDLVDVTLTGSDSAGSDAWVVTDADGNILGLPSTTPIDFDGAGVGVCFIWNLNYNGTLTGLSLGANVNNLQGCYDFSNPVAVNRYDIDSGSSNSTLLYNMDNCDATNGTMHEFDYSEFTPLINNSASCTKFSAGTVYRNNPTENPHSCTDGINGSAAMCVSSLNSCNYESNSDQAVRFDVTVTPAPNGIGSIGSLSFYEAAPANFQWINGMSGPNNFPTQYGIRVLRDGVEVFRQIGLATTQTYSQETFDFSLNPEFTVSTTSVFQFELLGYCLAGTNSTVSAWDLDNIVLTSSCEGGLNGGDLTVRGGAGGTTVEVCSDDGVDDNVFVNLLNAAGPRMAYVITDEDGNILDLPSGQPFNFEGAPAGTCLIWNLAFIDGIQGATVGANAADIQGCYDLSNPVMVIRKTGADCANLSLVAGTISELPEMAESKFCAQDNDADILDLFVEGNDSESSNWLLINQENIIVDMIESFPYDMNNLETGNYSVYHLSYNGELTNMTVGQSMNALEGDYELSNSLVYSMTECVLEVVETIPDYAQTFEIFPNPANAEATLKTDTKALNSSTFYIYDSFGRLVATEKLEEGRTLNLELGNYNEGVYYIKMISGAKDVVKKFTKIQ